MKKIVFSLVLVSTSMYLFAQTFYVESYNFKPGSIMSAPSKDGKQVDFKLVQRNSIPFCQSALKQTSSPGKFAQTTIPYYTVRYAIPIPAAYTPTEQGELVGLDRGVYTHMHSAGMDIMPNGDVFAVYFSTPTGKSEADTCTTFVQARLRCGSLEWDMPELFFDTHDANDQSALLWRDGEKMWFFGGGRDISDWVPFRYLTTTDNGATWQYNIPRLSAPATSYTAQPISNAFRSLQGDIYFASDGDGSSSFLWKSSDNGFSWTQLAGRTSGRHSTILPLDDNGTLLSIGGKNSNIDGWTPQNISQDWGKTWGEGTPSPFPQLGTAQRPCMIRLQSGNLLLVTDSYMHKKKIAPPTGWQNGNDCVVALSKDNGKTWTIKSLPITLPQHHRIEHPSLGYVTLRQADNGIIHILTTTNYPGLDIEFNEAWVLSSNSSQPSVLGKSKATTKKYEEKFPSGKTRIKWNAKIYDDGRYLLDGKEVSYYENGRKQHEVIYKEGRKSGKEYFWTEDGQLIWKWERNLKTNTGVWTQYYCNKKKRVVSTWNLMPTPRDLPNNSFIGYVAEGPATHYDTNGNITVVYNFHNGVTDIDGNTTFSGILNEGK